MTVKQECSLICHHGLRLTVSVVILMLAEDKRSKLLSSGLARLLRLASSHGDDKV